MKCLVTGAAGFIGSHLSEELLRRGHEVVGIDAFIPYYPRSIKETNLAVCRADDRFRLWEYDLRDGLPADVLDGVEAVFHLAAVPGLSRSWTEYGLYESCNIKATQRLLSAVTKLPSLKKFVYGSTSSVYGRYAVGGEDQPTRPVSPYGVTKLAAEHLCQAYAEATGLPVVTLRFFSVYGPRQRPDMGYYRFVQAFLNRTPITLFGDGSQVRGNTFVTDCAAAVASAADAPAGSLFNVGGGEATTTLGVIRKLERIFGYTVPIVRQDPRPGDQLETGADTTRLRSALGWKPLVGLDEGLSLQVESQAARIRRLATVAA